MIAKKHEWIIEELKELQKKNLIEKPRKRSKKGYAKFPIKWSIEGNFKDYGRKETSVSPRAFMTYNNGDLGGIVFIDNKAREIMKKTQLKKALTNPDYIKYRKNQTDKYGNMLLKLCNTFESKIKTASKKELMKLYNKFREIYTKYEFYNGIWFIISDDLLDILLKRLADSGCTDYEEIESLTTCSFQSFSNRENIDVLKAAIKISESNELNSFDDFKEKPDFEIIKKLVEKYYWIPFGHVGPELFDEKHYFDRINDLIEDNSKELKSKLNEAENFYPNIRRKQENISKKYNFDKETIRLIKDLHILSAMQDERKELIAKTHEKWINFLMKKIGSYFEVSPQEAAGIYPSSIENCLLRDKIDSIKKEEEKEKIEITEPEGYTEYTGEDAKKFLKIILSESNTGEIKGSCACRGKAKGKVKVLLNANEGHKIEQGDILVTTMTTPDFLPYMKKSGAIITDEGGITCHAAIVSRELGIPCIIGTKNATEILKDGDLVEVDATNSKVINLQT